MILGTVYLAAGLVSAAEIVKYAFICALAIKSGEEWMGYFLRPKSVALAAAHAVAAVACLEGAWRLLGAVL
jgi:hypothetical protein